MEKDYLSSFVGETVPVLFENQQEGLWRGHTDRYCEVSVPAREDLHNRLVPVTVTGVEGSRLTGILPG